jgi:hypothetical protein
VKFAREQVIPTHLVALLNNRADEDSKMTAIPTINGTRMFKA